MTEQKMTSLSEPDVVPDTPEADTLAKAMNLIVSLGAPDKTKKLLSELKVAAKANQKLVETASALKSEIDRREGELSELQADLYKRESTVAETNIELTKTATDLKNATTDLQHRSLELTNRRLDFEEKKEGAVSYIDGVLQNLKLVRKGLIDG